MSAAPMSAAGEGVAQTSAAPGESGKDEGSEGEGGRCLVTTCAAMRLGSQHRGTHLRPGSTHHMQARQYTSHAGQAVHTTCRPDSTHLLLPSKHQAFPRAYLLILCCTQLLVLRHNLGCLGHRGLLQW